MVLALFVPVNTALASSCAPPRSDRRLRTSRKWLVRAIACTPLHTLQPILPNEGTYHDPSESELNQLRRN
eukprot:6181506-Pleurochrysis_carterae.AAC.2